MDYKERALPKCAKCQMAVSMVWQWIALSHVTPVISDAFRVHNKKWHSFNTNCSEVVPNLYVTCVCVGMYSYFAVCKTKGVLACSFRESQRTCVPWVWGGSGVLGRASLAEQGCWWARSPQSLTTHHPVTCCLMLCGVPATAGRAKQQPRHRGDAAGSPRGGWLICNHRQADGTSWISNL